MLLGDLENTKNNFESNENALDAYARSIAHAGHTGFRRIQNPGDGDCLIYSLLHSVAGTSHCDCSQSTRDALRQAVRYKPVFDFVMNLGGQNFVLHALSSVAKT